MAQDIFEVSPTCIDEGITIFSDGINTTFFFWTMHLLGLGKGGMLAKTSLKSKTLDNSHGRREKGSMSDPVFSFEFY